MIIGKGHTPKTIYVYALDNSLLRYIYVLGHKGNCALVHEHVHRVQVILLSQTLAYNSHACQNAPNQIWHACMLLTCTQVSANSSVHVYSVYTSAV